jgi:hypothetical protein
VCDGLIRDADCKERTERGVAVCTAIEAENELVEIGLKVFLAKAAVDGVDIR